MVEDLLDISKGLLGYLNTDNDLEAEEREYIVNVIKRVVLVLILELGKVNGLN